MRLRILNFTTLSILILSLVGCSSKPKVDDDDTEIVAKVAPQETPAPDTIVKEAVIEIDHKANIDLVRTVYKKFVFGDGIGGNPKNYFTKKALKKLQSDYEYDCDNGPCYAFWALRTEYQDGDGPDLIQNITPLEDGWYSVSYLDMGYPGTTRVQVVDGKINNYKR